jgi:hypothetical protein
VQLTLLVDLDVLSLKPDKITNSKGMSGFLVALLLFLYFFFQKLKSSFGIGMDFSKVIEPLV